MRLRSRVGLIGAALVAALAATHAAAEPHADLVGSFVWKDTSPRFGGLSGFDLEPDALGYVAVSDSAAFFVGRLTRGAKGEVTAVSIDRIVLPKSHSGGPVAGLMDDAEGAALAGKGRLFVSYETQNRIVRYDDYGRRWRGEDWPMLIRRLPENAGLEALAIDHTGLLFAMPERSDDTPDLIPVFCGRWQDWKQCLTLRRDGRWRPVGADFGPDGRLYLLERDFWPLLGFRSRIRRITLDAFTVTEDIVLMQTSAGVHDNLEGLAAWRDDAGAIRLTMVSDDNFLPVQRTEIVDYRVVE